MSKIQIIEENAKNGEMTYTLEKNGRKISIYSKYNPNTDVAKRVETTDFFNFERVIILGAGIKESGFILKSGFNGKIIVLDSQDVLKAANQFFADGIEFCEIENPKRLLDEVMINPKAKQKIIKIMPLILLEELRFNIIESQIEKIIKDAAEIPDGFFKEFKKGFFETVDEVKRKEEYEDFDYTIAAAIEMLTTVTRRDNKYGL